MKHIQHSCQPSLVIDSHFVRKVLSEPALPVKSRAVYRHKSLPIANFPHNYRFGSVLQFTYYPEQHKPELSECQKDGIFPG